MVITVIPDANKADGRTPLTILDVPYSPTIVYDMNAAPYQRTVVTGDLVISLSGYQYPAETTLILEPDGVSHSLTFSGFKFFSAAPTTIETEPIMIALKATGTTLDKVYVAPATGIT